MAVDIFNPRSMTAALLQRKAPKSFLRDTFFSKVEKHASAFVDIHVKKGVRRLAPYVAADAQGKMIERIGMTGETFSPPYLKPKMVTTAADLLTLTAGEMIYMDDSQNSPQARAAAMLADDMMEMDDMIIRREELQASQALFGGVVSIVGEGVNSSIDFGIPAGNLITLSGVDLWTAATSDPMRDLRAWKRQIRKVSGINADICVFGREAYDAFISNANVQKQLDIRRFELGIVAPADMGTGVTFVGDIPSLGLEIWAYDEWYRDENTLLEVELVPSKKIMMTGKSASRKRHYRVIQDVQAGNFVAERFVKSWEEEDPSARFLLVQSGPLCVPHQIDAILNATVVA
jgi:hypothetical protein